MKKREYHGYRHHKLYSVWCAIKQRCYNSNNKHYANYGGRGIQMCDEWVYSAAWFIRWALDNGYREGLDIDRIDNNKGYSPENCRFTTRIENIKNTRLLGKNNTSGYRGVTYYERDDSWTARVSVNNRIKFLGRFKNRVDAAVVRDSYVIAHNLGLPLNFPQPINCIQAIREAS